MRFFQDRGSQTIYPGWLQTIILLIYASGVARITGVKPPMLGIRILFVVLDTTAETFFLVVGQFEFRASCLLGRHSIPLEPFCKPPPFTLFQYPELENISF
jgi:hypothetical protein